MHYFATAFSLLSVTGALSVRYCEGLLYFAFVLSRGFFPASFLRVFLRALFCWGLFSPGPLSKGFFGLFHRGFFMDSSARALTDSPLAGHFSVHTFAGAFSVRSFAGVLLCALF